MANTTRHKDVVVRFLVSGGDNVRKQVAAMNREMRNVDAAGKGMASSLDKSVRASNQARDASGKFVKKLKDTAPAAGNTTKKIDLLSAAKKLLVDKISSVNPKLGGLIEKFGATALKAGLVAAAITAVVLATSSMIKAGSQAETTMTKLGVIMHSEAAGMKAFEKAFQFSVVTPFEPQEVAEATAIAQGYLGQMGDAFSDNLFNMKGKMLETVKSMGPEMQDTAKNMNGTVMELAADMASYSGQTIQEATTALMRADLALLDKYGAAGRKAYMEAKKVGDLGTPEFLQAFVMNMRQVPEFIGMANKQSTTMSGLWSTIKGNIGAIPLYMSGVIEHGNGQITFWTRIKEIVTDLSNGIQGLVEKSRPVLVQLGTLMGNIFSLMWNAGKAGFKIFEPFLKVIGFLVGGAVLGALKIINGIMNGLIWILQGTQNIVGKIYSYIDKTFGITDKIQAFYRWMERASGFFQTMGLMAKFIWDAVIDEMKYKLTDFFYNNPVGKFIFGIWNGREINKQMNNDGYYQKGGQFYGPDGNRISKQEYEAQVQERTGSLLNEKRSRFNDEAAARVEAQDAQHRELLNRAADIAPRGPIRNQYTERERTGRSSTTNNNQQTNTTVINNTNIYRPVRERDITDRSGAVPVGAY